MKRNLTFIVLCKQAGDLKEMGRALNNHAGASVLVMSGDRDSYNTLEKVVTCAKAIPGSQLSIIAGCHHVVFFCNFPAVWESIKPFLGTK